MRGVTATLCQLAQVAIAMGDPGTAHQHLRESLILSRNTVERFGLAESLRVVADLALEEGDVARAATLWGAAAALRVEIGSQLPPSDYKRNEANLAGARALLGEAAFEATYARGSNLTWQQAVAYALNEPAENA